MRLVAALALVVGGVGAAHFAAQPAAATGDCSIAYIIFYANSDLGGGARKYCFGVNDTNVECTNASGTGCLTL